MDKDKKEDILDAITGIERGIGDALTWVRFAQKDLANLRLMLTDL